MTTTTTTTTTSPVMLSNSCPSNSLKRKKKFMFFSRSSSSKDNKKLLQQQKSIPLVGRTFSTTLRLSPQVTRATEKQPNFFSDSSLVAKLPPTALSPYDQSCYLFTLPDELLDYICSHLQHSDFGRFRQTCKTIYQSTSCQAKERKLLGISTLMRTNPDNVWLYAIRKKDMDILNYLRLHYPNTIGEFAVDEVMATFSQEVFSWMTMNYPLMFKSNRLTEKAAMTGNILAVKTLHKLYPGGCTEAALNAAVWNGHLKLAKWLDKKHSNLATEKTYVLSIVAGHLNIMKMLYLRHSKFRRTEFVESMCSLAVQKGRCPLAEWMAKAKARQKEFERAAITATTVAGGAAIAVMMCTIS